MPVLSPAESWYLIVSLAGFAVWLFWFNERGGK